MSLTQYDIKLLDDNPTESEINILQNFAKHNNDTYKKGWLNDKVLYMYNIIPIAGYTYLHNDS